MACRVSTLGILNGKMTFNVTEFFKSPLIVSWNFFNLYFLMRLNKIATI